MSIAGGYHKAVEAAADLGMDTVQLFTKNNTQWRAKPISEAEAAAFAAALVERKIARPISHASYLINLASPDVALRQKSVEGLVVELQRAAQLGIEHVIVHPGAHTTVSQEEGIALVAASLDEVHCRLPQATANVALEVTAGQGTCLGSSLAQLAAIIGQVKHRQRIGVCLDTCHLFAAGYDIRDRKCYLALWREFDTLLGRERLKAIHLNDSKRELGSRVDRHEHIGRGQIGPEGFRHFLRDRRLRHVPMYLETPKGDHNGQAWDAINLATLRKLAAG
jgi:deoxyribonuclease-4